jgi:hypothetical protein
MRGNKALSAPKIPSGTIGWTDVKRLERMPEMRNFSHSRHPHKEQEDGITGKEPALTPEA